MPTTRYQILSVKKLLEIFQSPELKSLSVTVERLDGSMCFIRWKFRKLITQRKNAE
jgi:hypothetical protein